MRWIACSLMLLAALGCNQEPASPAADAPSLPPGHPPLAQEVSRLPLPPSGTIEGHIDIAPELASRVAPGDTIYLIARNAATGSVVAVARLAAPAKFPLPFRLSGENVMLAGNSLSGKVRLEARVDKDGDALSKNPGDVVGRVDGLVAVPAEGVVLTLTSML